MIPYTSLYLMNKGFSNFAIGLIVASGNLLSAIIQPVTGTLMDSRPRFTARKLLLADWGLIIACGAVLILFPTNRPGMTAVVFVLLISLFQSAMPLVNIIGMETTAAQPLMNYNLGRATGSFGYAAASHPMVRDRQMNEALLTKHQRMSMIKLVRLTRPERSNI